ncbi:MAG: FKBP-type peptidyl-prolyl cis-trans isomerase [Treponema sp.]|nr:FKBP-type peptidyl-prolyl cis-trans isomerase [Treponema sp.]
MVNAVKQGDKIKSISIVRNGAAAQAFKTDQAAFDKLLAQAREAAAARVKTTRETDLAQIAAKYPGLQTGPNGVQYIIQKEGSGPKPQQGNTVQVNYTGMFLSGEVFDASAAHGGPLELQAGMGQVIPGWDQTIPDMKVGEKRLIVIPPELAYGERGAGGVIPPHAFLVFEMELVGIK